jgi:hypothetical protein
MSISGSSRARRSNLLDPARDLDLALGRLGHADLVDGQRDHRARRARCQRHDDDACRGPPRG